MNAGEQSRELTVPRLFSRAGRESRTGRWHALVDSVLNRRLSLLALSIVVLTISGIGIAIYASVRQSIAARAEEHLAAIAMLKAGQIEHWLEERRDNVQFVTGSPSFTANLSQWLQGGMRDEQLKHRLLEHLQGVAAIPHYRTLCIHSATDGSLLLALDGGHADSAHDRNQAIQAAIRKATLLDDLHLNDDFRPANVDVGYFAPITGGADSRPLAVAHLAADPSKLLFPILQQWPGSSSSAEALLLRGDGDSIVYLNTLRHRTDGPLLFRMPLDQPELLAAQAVQGKKGPLRGVDYRGMPSLGYALPVAGTPWLLLTKMDESEVYAHFNRMALFSALVTALSVLAAIWWIFQHSRSTARIERLSRLYAAISKTNQAIVHDQSPEQVYRAVCNACVELGGLRLVWIGLADPESERIVPVAAAGNATGYLDGLSISTRADIPEGRGPTGCAYRQQRVFECADYLTDPTTRLWQARAAEFGLACSISLPLRRAGTVIGTLCVYGGEKNFFDREAMKILTEMADNISFFLDHFDREVQRIQLAEEMARHVAEIEDLYQNAPCGYHSLDADGLIVRINDTELGWLGYAREEVVNRLHAYDLMTETSRQAFHKHFADFKVSGEIKGLEMEMVRRDGTILPVNLTASVVTDTAGHYVYSRTTVFDMTDIRNLEKERAAHESRLRSLSRRLVAVQEEERRQLVTELHDSASPNLAAIQVILSTMRISLAVGQPPSEIDASVEDALALLEDTGLNIREVCSELRPPLLDYSGLIPAIDGYAHQFSRRTGIAVHFNARGAARFSPEIESALFRITQEALTNCAKHANARSIDIELTIADDGVLLAVADNGDGFCPEALGGPGCLPGLGLINMRERAEFVGGTFEIASQPGRGTRITVRLALMQPGPDLFSDIPADVAAGPRVPPRDGTANGVMISAAGRP